MKLNKITKLGITLLSASLLGGVMANVAPVLTGSTDVVQAETTDENEVVVFPTPKMDGSYRVRYTDVENKDIAPPKEGLLKPGESIVEKPIHIPGFIPLEEAVAEWVLNYDIVTLEEYAFVGVDSDGTTLVSFGYDRDPNYNPNQDPSSGGNANTGGGANTGGSVGSPTDTPSNPDNGVNTPSDGNGDQGGQTGGSDNGGETTPVTPPASNEGGTTPAPTQPENGNPGTANPAPEQPNTGNTGTTIPGDNANANPPATSDNTSGSQGTEQPAQPEKPATPETPSTPTTETKPSDGKVEDKPSTGNASANTGDSGKADTVGNSGNAGNTNTKPVAPVKPSTNKVDSKTEVKPSANKSDGENVKVDVQYSTSASTQNQTPTVETKPETKVAPSGVKQTAKTTLDTATLPKTGDTTNSSVLGVLFMAIASIFGFFGFRKESDK